MSGPPNILRVTGVVLAAGGSKRLGQPKQLVVYDGKPLVAHAVHVLLDSGCSNVLTVLGAHAADIESSLRDYQTKIVVNEMWSSGISSSIASACNHLGPNVDAVLISLCDQPFIPTSHFESLVAAVSTTNVTITATEYDDGTHGVPAIFTSPHLAALRNLRGDFGAKELIRQQEHAALPLASEQQFDVDTRADLDSL